MQPGERVLDAACGNGLYARKLAALGADVVAFDFSEQLIALARERELTRLERADPTDRREHCVSRDRCDG